MIGGVKGSAIGVAFRGSVNVQLPITDTQTFLQEPVDYFLAGEDVYRRSPMGPVPLMKSIFGEK